jgi:hypothetical protein
MGKPSLICCGNLFQKISDSMGRVLNLITVKWKHSPFVVWMAKNPHCKAFLIQTDIPVLVFLYPGALAAAFQGPIRVYRGYFIWN